ncbi:MAG: hypothetical protein ACRD6N_01665, partial [Pyrinomonadaceae bacterium]
IVNRQSSIGVQEQRMARSFGRFAMAFSILVVLGSAVIVPVEGRRERFNPDGAFWILGDPPEAFKDFGGINLNSNRNRRLPAAGVDLTNGTQLRFRTVSITRSGLTFTTVPFRGLSYGFKGKFLQGGTFAARDLQDTPVLEGTLTKFSQGKPVAEAKLKFTYFGGT